MRQKGLHLDLGLTQHSYMGIKYPLTPPMPQAPSHPTCLTADWGLSLTHGGPVPHNPADSWKTNGNQLISTN